MMSLPWFCAVNDVIVLIYYAVNGGWSIWWESSPCSVTCGVGISTRSRRCNSPLPRFGGQKCKGPAVKKSSCDAGRPCPSELWWNSLIADQLALSHCAGHSQKHMLKSLLPWRPITCISHYYMDGQDHFLFPQCLLHTVNCLSFAYSELVVFCFTFVFAHFTRSSG